MKIKSFLTKLDTAFIDIDNGIVSDEGGQLAFTIQELNFYSRRLSTAQIGVVIALGASCLDTDEAYLNIGVWDGFSMLAASLGAPESTVIGVDNFSEMHQSLQPRLNPQLTRDYGDTRVNFYRALRQCGTPQTFFHEMDWEEFVRTATFPKGGLGLVFYDGEHTEEAHRKFFKAVMPYLSPECIILIDDIRIDFVRRSAEEFLSAYPNFQLLLELGGRRRRDPAWWGGLMVLGRYAKSKEK